MTVFQHLSVALQIHVEIRAFVDLLPEIHHLVLDITLVVKSFITSLYLILERLLN